MTTEKALISHCLKGDRDAQKALYEQHSGRLFAVCLRYADSHAEAQDILQDGFIKIYRDLPSYRPVAPLYAWMRTVIIRSALETIRRKKSRIGRGQEIDAGNHPKMQEGISAKMHADELMELVSALPDELRMIFNMVAIDGYSHREAAAHCGISESNSKVRLNRARKILTTQVEALFKHA